MARAHWLVAVASGGCALFLACTGGGTDSSSSGTGGTSTSSGGGSSSGTSSTSSSGSSGSSSSGSDGRDGGCRAQKDCTTAGDLCIGGNVPTGCGGAYIHECDVDDDCQRDGGVKVCSKGDCSGQNRCVDPQCTGPTDTSCPINQACSGRLCVAKPCTADGECSGFCVNGVCSATLGACGKQQLYP